MARALDITVVVAPPLRNAFDGRSLLSLGLPANADVGEVVETLLRLYPRSRSLLAGEGPVSNGRYMYLIVDGGGGLAPEGGGLSAGHKVFIFALSRAPAGSQAGLEG